MEIKYGVYVNECFNELENKSEVYYDRFKIIKSLVFIRICRFKC